MINRLYTGVAVTAALALSVSFALSRTATHHGAPQPAHVASASSAGASYLATAKTDSAGLHATAFASAAQSAKSGASHAAFAAGASSSTPTLMTMQGGSHVLANGAQRATPVAVSEDQAMQAIFKGGMWLPNATGGREYAKYDHHLIHDNGDWTWVGKVQTDHGLQSAVITFGKDAVFGTIPQASGNMLRLVTADGQKLLVQTDASKMAASPENVQLHARQDFMVPHRAAESARSRTASASAPRTASASAPVASAATTSGGPTIDVMVAYTPGLVSAYGSTSAALTRVNNLVDVTNQAYADSGVSQRIRLVHTMEVNYTDTNDNTKALDDLTGNDGNGNTVPVPSSLQGVASARTQYGADLVVLLRHFNNAGNNGCGVGWLIGGGEQQIVPSEDNAFGYSVVQDGSDSGYYCLDTTFAHELGHNMGSAHDRANASKDSSGNPIPGAYSYSFGYLGNGTNGFSTIMAYGSDTQTPLALFSNPNISKCQNSPCGVADTASNSADNVHSLNNTAALIAQFEPTKVAAKSSVHNDIYGDGKSDLEFYNPSQSSFAWWQMNGATIVSSHSLGVLPGPRVVATGDFNGDGLSDVAWVDASNNLYIWLSTGSGFTSKWVAKFAPGWQVVGAGDVDGDGKADLLFYSSSPGRLCWWQMNGTTIESTHIIGVGVSSARVAGVGDFNGDGLTDIAWVDPANNVYIWTSTGAGFASKRIFQYAGDWKLVGTADVDGDGKSDLLFYSASQVKLAWWLMDGMNIRTSAVQNAVAGQRVVSTGDFNGDGLGDVVWQDSSNKLYLWSSAGTGFRSQVITRLAAGWSVLP